MRGAGKGWRFRVYGLRLREENKQDWMEDDAKEANRR